MSADPQPGIRQFEPKDVFNRAPNEPFDLDSFMMSGKPPNPETPSSIAATMTPTSVTRNGLIGDGTRSVPPHPLDPKSHISPSQNDFNEQSPVWSEMKTKAGKDRKRLPLACIQCRRKKIRCSGEKPACKHCLKSRQPCVYKVTTRKAAPRTDYMAMLDKRLKRMEDRVMRVISKEDMQKLPDIARAIVKPTPPNQQSKSSKKRTADEAFLDRWAEPANNLARMPPPVQQVNDEGNLLSEGSEHLPSKEIQDHLTEVYFDYVYGQSYHLLHKPSFMRKLKAGKVPPMLLLAVCAVSARFANHPQVRTEPAHLRGQSWAKAALDIAKRRFDTPTISTLTVFLLLGLHTLGTCEGGQSWMLGGMAYRMAYALRLHEDLGNDSAGHNQGHTDDDIDREIRRRTMWACFLMDRFNSSGTGRPGFAIEEYLHIQLPIREQLFQMEIPGPTQRLDGTAPHQPPIAGQLSDPEANMGVAAYVIIGVALWGRLIHYFYLGGKEKDEHPIWSSHSTYRNLCSQVEDLTKSLPDTLKYNTDNLQTHAADNIANQFIYLHVICYTCKIFINNFAFPIISRMPQNKEMPPQFLLNGRKAAIEAATAIADLIEEGMNHRLVVPFSGYCAYLASVIHIHGTFSKNPQYDASSRGSLLPLCTYLNQLKRYWGVFHRMVDDLKRHYHARKDAMARGISTPNARLHQESIVQYGDWYDRYPNGNSQGDQDEPETGIKREVGDDAVLSQVADHQSVEEFFASSPQVTRAKHPSKKRGTRKPAVPLVAPVQDPPPEPGAPHHTADLSDLNHTIDSITIPHSPFGIPESYDRSQIRPLQAPVQSQNHLTIPSISSLDSYAFQPMQHSGSVQHRLDGQHVLLAYNGMDPTSGMQENPIGLWEMDMSGGFGDGFLMNDPTGAWFPPFNTEPAEFQSLDPGMMGQTFPGSQDFWYTPSERNQSMDANMTGSGSGG